MAGEVDQQQVVPLQRRGDRLKAPPELGAGGCADEAAHLVSLGLQQLGHGLGVGAGEAQAADPRVGGVLIDADHQGHGSAGERRLEPSRGWPLGGLAVGGEQRLQQDEAQGSGDVGALRAHGRAGSSCAGSARVHGLSGNRARSWAAALASPAVARAKSATSGISGDTTRCSSALSAVYSSASPT